MITDEPLSLVNTLWANTVLATGQNNNRLCIHGCLPYLNVGSIAGLVVYVGKETRSVLHTSPPRAKVSDYHYSLIILCDSSQTGLVDKEINNLTKVLFLSMLILAVIILSLKVSPFLSCQFPCTTLQAYMLISIDRVSQATGLCTYYVMLSFSLTLFQSGIRV